MVQALDVPSKHGSLAIGGWQRLSLTDYPGKIASIVFTLGCNFRCGYCHNPGLVLGGKHMRSGVAQAAIEDYLHRRQALLQAVVVTGGEPCLQPALGAFLATVGGLGLLLKLDTNGSRPAVLTKLLADKAVDYVAMDYKMPNDRLAVYAADSYANDIAASRELLVASDVTVEFRTTMTATTHDGPTLRTMADELPPGSRWFLQRVRQAETLSGQVYCPPNDTLITETVAYAAARGVQVSVR